jgi:DNA-binding NarL/FixJ family response regulator
LLNAFKEVRAMPLALVVAEDAKLRNMLSVALQLNGLRVVAAADTGSASSSVQAEGPDVVLIDLGGGFKAGIEAAIELAAVPGACHVTSLVLADVPGRAYLSPAVQLLPRRSRLDEIVAAVVAVLDGRTASARAQPSEDTVAGRAGA